jgi:hypothetical protein
MEVISTKLFRNKENQTLKVGHLEDGRTIIVTNVDNPQSFICSEKDALRLAEWIMKKYK